MRSLLFLALLVEQSFSIDLESAMESTCFDVKTSGVDTKWMESIGTWYVPLLNRFNLYNVVLAGTGQEASNISEKDLYYDGCLLMSIKGESFVCSMFNGKYDLGVLVRPEDPRMQVSKFNGAKNDTFGGTMYISLTDNKSFVFMSACMSNDQMAWGVLSPEKSLPKATVDRVHEHARKLGFSEKQFTGLRYDSCEKSVGETDGKIEL